MRCTLNTFYQIVILISLVETENVHHRIIALCTESFSFDSVGRGSVR